MSAEGVRRTLRLAEEEAAVSWRWGAARFRIGMGMLVGIELGLIVAAVVALVAEPRDVGTAAAALTGFVTIPLCVGYGIVGMAKRRAAADAR